MFESEGTASERASAYEFLAGIFLNEPTEELFKYLRSWATGIGDEEVEFNSLLKWIEDTDSTLEVLKQEYYDLFFVPVSGRFVPPFEAAIRGASREQGKKTKFGSFWGSVTSQVSGIYEQIGFLTEELGIFEPLKQMNMPDHIGFELSAMGYLCQVEDNLAQSGQGVEAVRKVEKTLLTKHLNQWLPLLKGDLKAVESTGFYLYFLQVACSLCEEEQRILERSGDRD